MAVGATPQVLLPLALTLTPSPTLPLPYPQAQPHPYPYPHQVGAARQLLVRQNQGHRDADVRGRRADASQCTHGAHVGHATGRGPHRAGCTPPEGAAAERDERAITWPDVPDKHRHGGGGEDGGHQTAPGTIVAHVCACTQGTSRGAGGAKNPWENLQEIKRVFRRSRLEGRLKEGLH